MLEDARIKDLRDLAYVCQGARNQLERDFALGKRSYQDTQKLADMATISALKLEERLRECD